MMPRRVPCGRARSSRAGRAPGTLAAVMLIMAAGVGAGCSERSAAEPSVRKTDRPLVACTTTMIADLARRIGQPRADVVGVIKPGTDPHTYDPTPEDAILFRRADLVLYNGLHLEGRLLDIIENSGARAVALAEDSRIAVRGKAGQRGAPDPHCWWNPRHFMVYTERARDALIEIDPDGAEHYRDAAAAYRAELARADAEVREAIRRIPAAQRALITSHDAFFYYGEAYGLTVDAVLGISTDAEVRALRAHELARLTVERKIRAVFHETSVSAALNQMIDRVVELAARAGHEVRIGPAPLYSDSLDRPGTPAGTYLGALKENTRAIVAGLSGRAPEGDG